MSEYDKDLNQTWETWRRYVIESIKKLNKEVETIKRDSNDDKLENVRQFTKLNTSATIYGVIGGTVISLLITIFSGFMIYHITRDATFEQQQQQYTIDHQNR